MTSTNTPTIMIVENDAVMIKAGAWSGWRIESHWTVSQGEVEIPCFAMGASYDP